MASSIHRILVIRLAAIGDVVLSTPVLRALRAAVPSAFIGYLTASPAARDLLKGNPDLDECLLSTPGVFEEIVRLPRFDLVLDLFGNRASQMVCLLSGARYRVGETAEPLEGEAPAHNIPLTAGPANNILEHYARFTRAAGIPDAPAVTRVYLDEAERQFAREWLAEGGLGPHDRWIGIQPGRRTRGPVWSEDKFVSLARRLARKFAAPVMVFEGPEDSSPIARMVCDRLGSLARLAPKLPVRQYAAVLERCGLLVASEGGPGHIAAALRVKSLVLFGAPNVEYWFPYRRERGMIALSDSPGEELSVDAAFSVAEELWNAPATVEWGRPHPLG